MDLDIRLSKLMVPPFSTLDTIRGCFLPSFSSRSLFAILSSQFRFDFIDNLETSFPDLS